MNRISTLGELFSYDDWAMSRLFDIALALPDEQLDRAFEIGLGSLRATLIHTFSAKDIWLSRVREGRSAKPPVVADRFPISALRVRWNDTCSRWNEFIATSEDASLDHSLDYNDIRGNQHSARLLDIILHVANHGVHHRAQAQNILRHVGAAPPRIDYIFRKIDNPPALSIDVVNYYYKLIDWARDRVIAACEKLEDSQLDRPFEMGFGTIRATLDHLCIAEEWWLASWRGKPIVGFPSPGAPPLDQIVRRFADVSKARNEILAAMKSDDELARPIEVKPAADRTLFFPLGATMIQLCTHGTHHRAQAVNMLRHLGCEPPKTDLILMTRKT